jgi:hypothetical protein
MGDTIFVMDGQGKMIPMQPSAYDAEAVLQALLADHPELLSAGTSVGAEQLRWLHVAREAAIPDDSGGDRFALDHLFLDSDGVPTLVEVKRSSDSRIRREVVGQMLDYASHFVIHWTMERVRATFERTCDEVGLDASERLVTFLGATIDEETFWQRVKTNLAARRIRLLFVADNIPPELRRVVEFLNAVTDPVEVLAIEVPQYTGAGMKTFVPRLIGQTAATVGKKGSAGRTEDQWNEARFFEALKKDADSDAESVARKILEWSRERNLRLWWGSGRTLGSFIPAIDTPGDWHPDFIVKSNGKVEIQFQHMRDVAPLGRDGLRSEVWRRLNNIPGISLPEEAQKYRPSIALAVLAAPGAMEEFLQVWDWYIETVRTVA